MHRIKTPHRPAPSRVPSRVPGRPNVQLGLDWEASGWAGLVAGIVFLGLQTMLGALLGGGNADAIHSIASIALGESVETAGRSFPVIVYLAAAAVHVPLSLIYARALAALIDGMKMGRAVVCGTLFGAALYGVNYYVFSRLFPLFASARGPAAVVSHLVFGALAAAIYTSLARRRDAFR